MKILLFVLLSTSFSMAYSQNANILQNISKNFISTLVKNEENKTYNSYKKFYYAIQCNFNSFNPDFIDNPNKLQFEKDITLDSIASLITKSSFSDFLKKYIDSTTAHINKGIVKDVDNYFKTSANCIDISTSPKSKNIYIDQMEKMITTCEFETLKDTLFLSLFKTHTLSSTSKDFQTLLDKSFAFYAVHSKLYNKYLFEIFYYVALEQISAVLNAELGFGRYFKTCSEKYEKKDFAFFEKYFPDYKKYLAVLKSLHKFKKAGYTNEVLIKKGNGSWIFSRKFIFEDYERKMEESVVVSMTFEKLQLKPIIKSMKISDSQKKINVDMFVPPPINF